MNPRDHCPTCNDTGWQRYEAMEEDRSCVCHKCTRGHDKYIRLIEAEILGLQKQLAEHKQAIRDIWNRFYNEKA